MSNEDGTIFELYFPITRNEVTADVEQASWENYAINHETILVIDDERLQKEIECGLLIKLGYSATLHDIGTGQRCQGMSLSSTSR